MASLYLGLDLGGSGTRAALVDATGQVLATGRGPSAVHRRGAASRRDLSRALDAALASIRPLVADRACEVFAGTRGLSVPGRRDSLLLALRARVPLANVNVSNDAQIALWGALGGRQGVAVVAGAGSIALARTSDGRQGRAGGWGYLLGDDGSGFGLGRETLRSYLEVLEGRRPPGELSRLVANAVGRAAVTDVLGWFYSSRDLVERLAGLAPLVSQAAESGDPVACTILGRGGRALAEIAASAARQLWAAALPAALPIGCCGGVWSAGRPLDEAFSEALDRLLPGAVRVLPRLSPVGGAVLLAMSADRSAIPDEVLNHLMASLTR